MIPDIIKRLPRLAFFLFVALWLCTSSSCSLPKYHKTPSVQKDSETPNNQIAFLNFIVDRQDENSKTSIRLVGTKFVPGQLKQSRKNTNSLPGSDCLIIYQYYDEQLIDSQIVEHPLYKHVEGPQADSSFLSKTVILTHAEFFIRLAVTHQKGNVIIIFEKLKNEPRVFVSRITFTE